MNGERFHRAVLYAAAAYNVVFGAFAVLVPHLYWEWLGLDVPRYEFLWQCIGMIVGCYGVAYFFAARAPRTLWPIVLVGLLGKIFGPLGFLMALSEGTLPWRFGWILVTNDLIWWIPFFSIVVAGWRHDSYLAPRAPHADAKSGGS